MTNPTARSAIRTRYKGPTDTKGSRLIATDSEYRITVGYNHALNPIENHAAAAQAFLDKHNSFKTKLAMDALCFDNDYYWTWEVTGPRITHTDEANR